MKTFSTEAVEQQLERITLSPEFAKGAKLCEFLNYVVGRKLAGNTDGIKQYSIAVEGLGYDRRFDPMTNPTVRILAGRLRRALDRYYQDQGKADPICIEIPKGSYVPVFSDRATECDATAVSETSRILAQLSGEAQRPTVAVIEFQNSSDSRDGAVVSVGLTAEIMVALTRFTELTIVGPLVPGNGEREDFHRMLREQGARFALQGWVRTSGSNVRITVDLLDTWTGSSLWARTFAYNIDASSLFEIEDEVTANIAGVIGDGLGVPFHRLHAESYPKHIKFNDVTAAVLAHNYYWTKISALDWRRANDAVRQALARHPDNALLIALQSNLYYGDVVHCLDIFPDSVSRMDELSDRAIAIDPDLQIAQYNRVTLSAYFGRTEECVATARRVVEMNPNQARILAGCAVAVASVGAFEFGKQLIEKVKRLNPQYPGWYLFVDFFASYHDRQYDEAWTNARLIETPGLLWGPVLKIAALGKLGRVDEAQPFVEELLQVKPDFRERHREYVRRLFITDEHVDMICDGLSEAGLSAIPSAR